MSLMYQNGLLLPILALIAWTFVMWFWLYATRIPAMRKAGIDPQEFARAGTKPDLPPQVTRVADNYNHLHEQPTIFYVLALVCDIAGAADGVNIGLGWLYVSLRIGHSLIQATGNIIVLRFAVFNISQLVLIALFVRTAMVALGQG